MISGDVIISTVRNSVQEGFCVYRERMWPNKKDPKAKQKKRL